MVCIENISKSYGKRQVISSVSFCAKPGERVAIIGRNGCGKTTLLQILAGVIPEDAGQISYFGKSPKETKHFFRDYCGYVPQVNPLMEELSVTDNLRLWGFQKTKHQAILQEFELEGLLKTKVEKLSGGMKRRLSIACACLNNPPILILDEPTTALDVYYREKINTWLQDFQNRGGIVILTTHEESEVLEANHCILILDGKGMEYDKNHAMQRILK